MPTRPSTADVAATTAFSDLVDDMLSVPMAEGSRAAATDVRTAATTTNATRLTSAVGALGRPDLREALRAKIVDIFPELRQRMEGITAQEAYEAHAGSEVAWSRLPPAEQAPWERVSVATRAG